MSFPHYSLFHGGIVNLIFSLDEFSPLQPISRGQSGMYEREKREEVPLSRIFSVIISTILIKLTIPVHCLCCRNYRASGNYGPARRRCEYARPPHACALCSQEHRPCSSDAVVQAAPLSLARHVAGRFPASHRCQRPRVRCLLDL